jgi:transposase
MQPEASGEEKKMKYVGVDIGKWKCRAAVMNPDGSIYDEFTFNNDHEGITNLASKLTTEDRVVMESTGSVWTNLYDSLEERHVSVVLANPLKTKAIASARIKSDKVDARILAHLLRGDLVAECYVPSKELREIRTLVRHRSSLVRARTSLKNRVHAIVDGYGFRCKYTDMFGKGGIEWLRGLELGALDGLMLDNHLSHHESLSRQIRRVDEEIRRRASVDEDFRLLLSLTGVDVYTTLLIRSEIGDIGRFPGYKRLVS